MSCNNNCSCRFEVATIIDVVWLRLHQNLKLIVEVATKEIEKIVVAAVLENEKCSN